MCPAHGSRGAVSAAGRIASVLDAFRDDRDALTLSELARRAALPKTTTHRLTGELVRCGLLERADGELRLGLKLFELGQLVPQQRSLRDAARPVMADLREATRHSVNLGILEGADVVYVDILAGPARSGLSRADQPETDSAPATPPPVPCTGLATQTRPGRDSSKS